LQQCFKIHRRDAENAKISENKKFYNLSEIFAPSASLR
jgi:hypothetical protein